jgi:hypothetical protein
MGGCFVQGARPAVVSCTFDKQDNWNYLILVHDNFQSGLFPDVKIERTDFNYNNQKIIVNAKLWITLCLIALAAAVARVLPCF